MVTLLFAVFVVLYAIEMSKQSSQNAAPAKLAGSMQESFNTPLQDIPEDRRLGPTEQGIGIFDHFRGNATRPSVLTTYPSATARLKIIDDEMHKVKQQIEDRLYGPHKHRNDSGPGHERVVSVQKTSKGFKLQLAARHFFDAGSVTVSKSARMELDEVAKVLKNLGRPVTIEGHTDSTTPTGTLGNWEISALRATNVLRHFVRQHGFPPSSLSVAGYADMKPIAHNGSESGRMLNRRIEIHVEYDNESAPEPAE